MKKFLLLILCFFPFSIQANEKSHVPNHLLVQFKESVFELPPNKRDVSVSSLKNISPDIAKIFKNHRVGSVRLQFDTEHFKNKNPKRYSKKRWESFLQRLPSLEHRYLLRIEDPFLLKDLKKILEKSPLVLKTSYDEILLAQSTTPDDTEYESQNLDTCTNLEEAWDITTSASHILIGVMDGGFQENHTDLEGAVDLTWNSRGGSGGDPTSSRNVCNEHGTHVAGIIGAQGNNEMGVAGVVWEAQLALYRIGDDTPIDPSECESTSSDGELAIETAVDDEVDIINRSFSYSDWMIDDVQGIETTILWINAAGNDGVDKDSDSSAQELSALENVIQVANADSDDCSPYSSTDYGDETVHLAAPGVDVYSTYPTDTYESLTGTSMAAPVVTGIAALAWNECPALSVSEIRNVLLESVTVDSDYKWSGLTITEGVIDAETAVKAVEGYYEEFEASVEELGKLLASDGGVFDSFGYALSLDGETLAIGSLRSDSDEEGSGSVYIFEPGSDGETWEEIIKIRASDYEEYNLFGVTLDLDGDTLAVSAYKNDDTSIVDDAGAVYIFERDYGGEDNWGEVKKIIVSEETSDDTSVVYRGFGVSLDGDTLAVGVYRDDTIEEDAGAVIIYERDFGGEDNWGEVAKITPSDIESDDAFGVAVSLDGDTLAVGADYDDSSTEENVGSVYIFERDEGGEDAWGQIIKIQPSDAESGDYFGDELSLKENTLAVGARGQDGATEDTGSVYIFERDEGGEDAWGQVAQITVSDETDEIENAYFGLSLSLDNDTLAVGSYKALSEEIETGAVYIYERNYGGEDNWGEKIKVTPSDGASADYFGRSVDFSSARLAVGSIGDDDTTTFAGSAYIFNYDDGSFPIASLETTTTTVNETEEKVELTLTLDKAVDHDVSVHYDVTGDTAEDGDDFDSVSRALIIPAGSTTETIEISIINDYYYELSDETFTVTLTDGCGVNLGDETSATVTIESEDEFGVEFSPESPSLEEGKFTVYSFQLKSKPLYRVRVELETKSQLVVYPSNLYISASEWNTPQKILVYAKDDSDVEGDHKGRVIHTLYTPDPNYRRLKKNLGVSITDND